MRTMNNTPRFLSGLLLVLAVGCAKAETAAPAPTPSTETQAVATINDLAPRALFKLAAPANVALEKASASMPGTPKNVLKPAQRPETLRFKETTIFVPAGSTPGDVGVPVDTTDGTMIYVGGKSADEKQLEASEKDVTLLAPGGKMPINRRAPRSGVDKAAALLKSSLTSVAVKAAEDKPLNAIALDATMGKGVYTLRVGSTAAKSGMTLDIRLPASPIEMSVTPSAMTFFPGDDGTMAVELMNGTSPIAGAKLEADLVRPDGSKAGTAPVRDLGNGKYEVLAAKPLNESSAPGVWNVFVRAKGEGFDRYGAAAFELAIPTAKIASASTPRLVKSASIDAFEVDVTLDVASLDRYEVSATLVSIGADGTERPVALAQSAEGLDAGKHTMTLRFDAGFVKLTGLEGSLAIRSLQLFSQGRNSLYQRHHNGLDLKFPTIVSAELTSLREITPAVQLLIDNGEFDFLKK